MRKVIIAVIASTLALSSFASRAADLPMRVGLNQDTDMMKRSSVQNHMFDGINLTEQQRQQMRDLMQRARHDSPPVNISEMETMHSLVTAEHFDETAVKILTEKMLHEQVARQVEMAKVRNQMYRLLTPEQQAVLAQKHQQRMEQYRELSER
ncbi:cell-envelope stress modulator CpxP [Citrobacter sp. JGM124]|uniref:cell-envelope stress modulator CpxP n=1 Tax=Citrobacter sp. JGM124 TaxID=2799789 RepID=UPI001BAD8C2B|nr:cell-envelope stress modulator CpxP [Citrobacter sp. JGM124]MBS0849735.1 cell-envelope stress modulator CpxP [Citrobacter sp. JGM124]